MALTPVQIALHHIKYSTGAWACIGDSNEEQVKENGAFVKKKKGFIRVENSTYTENGAHLGSSNVRRTILRRVTMAEMHDEMTTEGG